MITKSDNETRSLGQKLGRKFVKGAVVCLRGGLGAGKTTLIQGIAQGLGIKSRISSPTFTIVHRHKLKDNFLWHIDLYRLTGFDEAKAIGMDEILKDKNSVVLIEWPEKINELLPKNRWEIRLEVISENKREISYEALH